MPFLIGGVLCILFAWLDNYAFDWAASDRWKGAGVWATFVAFVLQAFTLSSYSGFWLKKSRSMMPAWIFFFVWSLIFTDLILALFVFNANWDTVLQLALAYAFFAGQVGLVVVWGILSDYDWRKRLPLFGFALVCLSFPFWPVFQFQRGWNAVYMFYAASVLISCGILRFTGFRISAIEFGDQPEESVDNRKQFGIRNVMIWTLIVAIAVGFGRWVPWSYIWENVWAERLRVSFFGGMLTSVITVTACWAALGRQASIWFRVPLLILILIGVAYGVYQIELSAIWSAQPRGGRWVSSLVLGYFNSAKLDHASLFGVWLAWCGLNGFFLFGLLQLFAFAGCKLVHGKR